MSEQAFSFPKRRLTLVVLALVLSGCASLGERPATPSASTPAGWSQSAPAVVTSAAPAPDPWWQRLGDPTLSELVERALARNNELGTAAVRVRRAQALAGLTEQNQRPTFGGNVGASASRPLDGDGSSSRSVSANLTVSYEVDLWGRLARATDAARFEAEATEQDRQALAASVAASTAQTYWQLAFLNQRIASADASLAFAERTLGLVRVQREAGSASGLELAEAEQSLAGQRATRAALEQQRVAARHALALLLDQPPQDPVPDPPRLATGTLPEVEAGLPAELLARRPDLRAAEARLRANLAGIDIARSSFYPSLSLTGGVGSASRELSNLFTNPVGSLAASLALPFLQWEQRKLELRVSEAEYEAAAITFRQTLYTALGEVEDALSARRQLALQGEQLSQALDAARRAERLYELRWRTGAEPLRVYLQAEESRRQAELALDANRLEALNAHAALVLALGGDATQAAVQAAR